MPARTGDQKTARQAHRRELRARLAQSAGPDAGARAAHHAKQRVHAVRHRHDAQSESQQEQAGCRHAKGLWHEEVRSSYFEVRTSDFELLIRSPHADRDVDQPRRADPYVHLCHPQHRRRGQEGRGGRAEGAVPEHRRSDSVRLQDTTTSDRRGRQGHARRAQRLHRVRRCRARARGGRGRVRPARRADDRRSRDS
jgi:hypothetical protein